MKYIILFLGLLSLSQCIAQKKSGSTETKLKKHNVMFEKFDFDLDSSNYVGLESVNDSYNTYGSNGFYKLINGIAFKPGNYKQSLWYYVIPESTSFYSVDYIFFAEGNLNTTGSEAGFGSDIKIGDWKYYDKDGKLTNVINEDQKFGLWEFNKVLGILDEDDVIDLKTGKNREYKNLRFLFDKGSKIWTVKIYKRKKNAQVDEYWEYLFDGSTGKYSRDWYEIYNDDVRIMMGETGTDMPQLKNSKKNKSK